MTDLTTISATLAILADRYTKAAVNVEATVGGSFDIIGGTLTDPASYNATGGKTGTLGYYKITDANGNSVYFPCLQRILALAVGSTGNVAALQAVVDGYITSLNTISATTQTNINASRDAAAVSATAANNSKIAAGTSETNSGNNATTAVNAKTASESARDLTIAARDTAVNAKTDLVAARDLAQHYANDSTDVAVPGQADATARGAQFWSIKAKQSYDLLSVTFANAFSYAQTSAFSRAFVDQYGRFAFGIKSNGQVEAFDFYAKTATLDNVTITKPLTVSGLTMGESARSVVATHGARSAVVDQYGRIAFSIRHSGRVEAFDFGATTATIDYLTVTKQISIPNLTLGDGQQTVVPSNGWFKNVVDKYGHWSSRLADDGSVHIHDLRDSKGAAVFPRLATAEAAIASNAANISTLTLRDVVKQFKTARDNDGFYPQRPLVGVAAVATLSTSQTTPTGATAYGYATTGKWRFRGAVPSQFGANAVMQFNCRRYNGNGNTPNGAGALLWETVHTGTKLYVCFRGSGTYVRVIVDGKYQSMTQTYINPDGQYWYLTIDFAGVSATRKIVVEVINGQFAGMSVPTGEILTAPVTTPPLIACTGTSITEAGNSWALWMMYQSGCNVYNTGIGSSGVLNNGQGGRVRVRRRSDDFVVPNFIAMFDENGINDSGQTGYLDDGSTGNLYADMSFMTIFNTFYDEYRRILDLWFAAHPNSPWIAWGPYWPNDGLPESLWAIRDAKQRALSEYRLGGFVDTIQMPLVKGSKPNNTYPGNTYTSSDYTHPIEFGQEHIHGSLWPFFDQMMRTQF